ncbi:MAG: AzlC family ABC transporter permease [Chloroflexota bacterium]
MSQSSKPVPTPTRQSEFFAGVRDTLPLEIGAVPFAIIFGVVAMNSGFSALGTMGLSLFVFAGSAQLIGAQLVAGGAALWVIVFTTFVVNLRHVLYSATLSPHMKHLPQKWLLPLGFWLTDETFVIVVARYTAHDQSPYKHWYHLGSALFMYINWNVWTLIGIVAGQTIPDMSKWGFDFALYVTFIGMLIPIIKSRPVLLAAVVGGLSAVLFHSLPNQIGLIVAALLGVAAGVIAENLTPSPQPDLRSSPELKGEGLQDIPVSEPSSSDTSF